MIQELKSMGSDAAVKLVAKSLMYSILIIVAMNTIAVAIELVKRDDTESLSLIFNSGYFVLDGRRVGMNIFANLAGFFLIFLVTLYYFLFKQRIANPRD